MNRGGEQTAVPVVGKLDLRPVLQCSFDARANLFDGQIVGQMARTDDLDAIIENEQPSSDVGLEVGCIHRSPQDVRRFPEVRFKLAQGNCRIMHDHVPFLLLRSGLICWRVIYPYHMTKRSTMVAVKGIEAARLYRR